MNNLENNRLKEFIKNSVSSIQKSYDNHIVGLTKKYQKKYNFDMKNSSTHNNQADAFKHAFLSAEGSCFGSNSLSFAGGWSHEISGFIHKQPMSEFFMDSTNNEIGRRIGLEVKKELGHVNKLDLIKNREKYYDLIAEKIMKKMKSGELVTDVNDKRIQKQVEKYENFKKYTKDMLKYNPSPTGFATNIDESLLNLENRVFYDKEINPNETNDKEVLNKVIGQYFDNGKRIPSKEELNQQVASGDLIYVQDYSRSDGTKVSGYYRTHKNK